MSDRINQALVYGGPSSAEVVLEQEQDFLALEERIMFDGAMGVEAVDYAIDHAENETSKSAPEPDLEAAATAVYAPASDRSEIYFVDAGVDNPDDLISAIPDGAEVVVLDRNGDGVAQMAAILDGRENIDAIHILSHGGQGQLSLGNAVLNETTMQGEHLDDLTAIGAALSADGDILIYGCDFSGGEQGLEAVRLLGGITEADIAASEDPTGHSSLGGDWELETAVGSIQTETFKNSSWLSALAQTDTSIVIVDTGGVDDVTNPDRNDLTQLSIDYSNSANGELTAQVQLDETFAGGGNTINVSMIFDIDGDGNADYAYFVIMVDDNPLSGFLVVDSVELLDGSRDGSSVKLSGNTTSVPLIATTATTSLGTNPFNGGNDTLLTLTINTSEIIANEAAKGNIITADDITMVNVSTHPSASATSNPSESVIDASYTFFLTDDNGTTLEDTAITIDVLGNDSTGVGSYSITTDPTNGTVTINADGTVTYTPNPNYSGTDSFVYTSCSIDGTFYNATVTVEVTPDADAPAITATGISGDIDTLYAVPISNGLTDTDGSETLSEVLLSGFDSSLTFSSSTGIVTDLGSGTWSVSQVALPNLQVSGTNAGSFSGTASVTSTETSNGDTETVSTGFTVTLSDTGSNDPPVATPSTSSGDEDSDITVDLAGTDVDGTVEAVTVTTLPPASEGVLYLADGTTPVVAGTPLTPAEAASLVFTPAEDFNGDVTIAFTVTDDDGATSAATNEVITVNDVNDPPVATPSTSSGDEDSDITVDLAGTDVDGTVEAVTVTTLPPASEGVLYLADGTTPVVAGTPLTPAEAASLVFTPAEDFNGDVTIAFTVTDDDGATSAATNEVITVNDVNDPPVATPSTSSGDEDSDITVDLAGTDVDGTVEAVTVTTLPPASEGVLYLADGTTPVVAGTPLTPAEAASLVFTPAEDFNGDVTIAFTVTDDDGATSAATNEVITVNDVNDPPVATPSTSSGDEDSDITVDLAGTDVDGTVEAVTVTTLPPASEGVLYLADGTTPVVAGTPLTPAEAASLVFTPAEDFNGDVTIAFTVTDDDGATSAATNEVITVNDVNDPPVATPSTSSGDEDSDITVDLAGTDVDGTVEAVTVTTLPPASEGVLYLADGTTPVVAGTPLTPAEAASLVFTPAEDFNGDVTIAFTVTDDDGATSAATNEVITVNDVNDPPVATPSTSSGDEDSDITVDLAGTDVDGTVEAVTVTTLPPASEGVLYLADGTTPVVAGTPLTPAEAASLVFTPAEDFNGDVTIAFTVTDDDGATSAATNEVITVNDVNDPPVATPSTSSGDEDSDITVDLAGTDVDGTVEAVTVTTLPPASEGVLYLADGTTPVVAGTPLTPAEAASLVFTPAEDFNGDVTIAFTVTDDDGATSAATNEVITVNDVNDPPVATPSTSSGDEDSDITVDLAGTDVDGTVEAVTVTTLPPASEGVLYLADGTTPVVAGTPLTPAEAASLVFTPAEDFNGDVTIAFTVTDDDGATSAATNEVITVNDVNDPPVADDDSFTTAEDTPSGPIDLLDGDTDVDGDTLSVASIAGTPLTPGTAQTIAVSNGTVNVSATGEVTFTPDADYNGPVSFDYVVSDANGGTDTAVVSGYVEPLPEGGVVAGTTAEDSPVTINPLENETPGDVASVTLDGPLPEPAAEGSFSYTDPSGATVVLTAADLGTAAAELSPAEAATLVFTPAPDFNGVVPPVGTTITNVSGDTAAGLLEITVIPVNDPPVADDETFTVLQDSGVLLIDVLDGDTDVDGDALTITHVDGQPVTPGGVTTIVLGDGSGRVVLDDSGAVPVVTFTPEAGYNGPSSFTYTIADPSGASTTASVTGEVDPVAVPAALVADTPEDTPIGIDPTEGQTPGVIEAVRLETLPAAGFGSFSYTDPSGATVVLAAADLGTAAAVLSPAEAATLVFTPAPDYAGPVSDGGTDPRIDFTLISNGGATEAPGTYEINVTSVNDPPVAVDDTFTVNEDGTVTIAVLGNDSDVDDPTGALFVSEINGIPVSAGDSVDVGNGTATLNADGTIGFAPDADFNGPISFGYTLSDATGGTDTGTVTGYVEPLPEGGVVASTTAEDSPVAINPLENETPGDVASVTLDGPLPEPAAEGSFSYTDAGGATVVLTAADLGTAAAELSPAEAATLVFTPAPDFSGVVPPVGTTITDGNGDTATGSLAITVTPVNDAPVGVDDTIALTEDTPVSTNVLGNDTDAEGNDLTISAAQIDTDGDGAVEALTLGTSTDLTDATGDPIGTITVEIDGTVSFTPAPDYTGPVPNLTYTPNDGTVDGSPTTVSFGPITAVNDAPVADDDSFTTAEDTPSGPIDLLDGDTDVDGDTLSVASIAGTPLTPGTAQTIAVSNGTVNVSATGEVTFTPDADYNGPVSFDYVVSDANGGTDTAVVSGYVEPLPEGGVVAGTTAEDSPVTINPLENETPGDVASVTLDGPLPDPAAEGSFSYTDPSGATVVLTAADLGTAAAELSPAEAATLVFTPAPDFNGVVPPVGTTITNVSGDTAAGLLEITVIPVNDPPVADDETFTVLQDSGVLLIDVLDGDTDVDGDALTITHVDGQPVTPGGVTTIVLGDGSGRVVLDDSGAVPVVTFTPEAGYNGPSSFTYTIADPSGASTTASVTGEVDPVAVPAALVADTPEDTPIGIDPTEGQTPGVIEAVRLETLPAAGFGSFSYTDPSGATVVLAAADLGTAAAVLSPAEAATLVFTPAPDYAGPVSDGGTDPRIDFTLISNGGATEAPGTYEINVTSVNDPPVAVDDTFTVNEDGTVTIAVLGNDSDVDDPTGALFVSEINGIPVSAGDSVDVGNGTATLNADGTIGFAPDADFNGPISFGYTLSDATGGTDTGTVTGYVEPLPEGGVVASTTAEDSPVAINPLENETPGDVASVTLDGPLPEPAAEGSFSYTDAGGATVVLTAADLGTAAAELSPAEAATLVFTPAPDFSGVVPPVGTTITDGNGDTATGSLAITVTPVNDAPVGVDDTIALTEDTPVSTNVLGNDTDAEGNDLTISAAQIDTDGDGAVEALTLGTSTDLTDATGDPIGTITVEIDGTVSFTPAPDYTGPVPNLTYTPNDGTVDGSPTTVSFGPITAVNDAPVADDDSFTTAEDTPSGPIDLLDGDTDVDGDTLSVASIAGTPLTPGTAQTIAVSNGTVNVSATGEVTFTPDADYNGPVSFDYVVSDANGGTDTAVVSGYVEPLPEGGVVAGTTAEDSPVTINPLENETPGDVASVTLDGPLPEPAAEGSFSYTDPSGATVVLTAADLGTAAAELSPAEAATLVFTPAPDFNGVVPPVGTTITNVSGDTAAGLLEITVIPVNDPPVADDETFTVLQDSGVLLIDVLDGDTDVDGDALTITHVDGQPVTPGGVTTIVLGDGSGRVVLDDSGAVPVVTFTPEAGYNGPSSFTYTIADPSGASTTASVTGEVDPVAVPAALVADTPEDTPIGIDPTEGQTPGVIEAVRLETLPAAGFGSFSYTDPSGATVVLAAADLGTAAAVLSPAEAATLVFTPAPDYAGPVSDGGTDPRIDFTLISNGGATEAPGTYEINVTSVNDPPVAVDDTFTVNEDGTVTIAVLGNDSDVDDPTGALFVSEINGIPVSAGDSVDVGNGTATLNADGTIGFAPDADFNGPISFGYTLSDATGGTDTGTVTGYVEPLPEGGVVASTTAEDSPVAINPLENETPGDVASVTLDGPLPEPAAEGSFSYTDAGGATVVLTAADLGTAAAELSPAEAATLVFTPAPDFSGVVPPVGTTITDGNGDTATGSLAITVTPVNDAPVGVDDTIALTEDTPVSTNVLGNDTDAEGNDLTISAAQIDTDGDGAVEALTLGTSTDLTDATGDPIGTITVEIDGTVSFTPAPDYTGPVPNLTYTPNDGTVDGSPTTVSFGPITAVNDAPVADDDSFTTAEDTPSGPIDLLDGDTDVDGDTLSVASIAGTPLTPGTAQTIAVSNGTVNVSATGEVTFTPDADYNGPVSFDYVVSDANGGTDTAVVSGYVEPLPEGGVVAGTTAEDSPVTINPLENETPGDVASVTLDGPLPEPAAEGSFSYTDPSGATVVLTAADLGTAAAELSPAEAATLVFTPAPDFNGVVPPVGTTITNVSGDTAAGLLEITVIPVNDPPVADDETFTVLQDSGVLLIDVLDGDTDVDGDALTITHVDGQPVTPGGVTTIVLGDGSGRVVLDDSGAVPVVTFTPEAGYNGPSSFTYTIADPSGASTTASVTGEVDPVAVPAALVADTPEDTPIGIDPTEGQTPGVIEAVRLETLPAAGFGSFSYTDPSGATVVLAAADLGTAAAVLSPAEAATLVFTPAPDYAGPVSDGGTDPRIDFTLISNGGATEAPGTYEINVTSVNDPPVAVDDTFTVNEDGTVTIAVLGNDSDVDDPTGALFVSEINGIPVSAGDSVDVGNGTATLNADGTIGFAPDADFNGPISFGYTLSDATGGTDTGTVTGYVEPLPEGGVVASTTAEDSPVAINPLENETPGDVASVTLDGPLPEPAAEGSFSYTDAGGATVVLTAADLGTAAAELSPAEAATLVFTPAPDFSGVVPPVGTTITDGNGDTATGSLAITVTPVNDAPVGVDDTIALTEDTPVSTNVLGNDTDAEGNDLTISAAQIDTDGDGAVEALTLGTSTDLTDATGDPIGTITVEIDGTVSFTPAPDYTGPVPNLTYTPNDGTVDGSPTTVSFGPITAVNDAPVADDDSFTTAEDTPSGPIDLLDGDTDVDGDTLSVASIAGTPLTPGTAQTIAVSNGTVNVSATGEVTFTPDADYNGPVSFDYVVSDANGGTDTAVVSGYVEPLPEGGVVAGTTAEDSPVTINPLENETPGDVASVTLDGPLPEPAAEGSFSYTDPSGATVVLTAADLGTAAAELSPAEAATLVFTPAPDFSGVVPPVGTTITDGNGDTATGSLAITVTPVNDAPVGVDDTIALTEDTPVSTNVLGNDTDAEGNDLTISAAQIDTDGDGAVEALTLGTSTDLTDATGDPIGTITVEIDGTVSFTPAPDYTGPVPNLTYTPNDGTVDGSPTTVSFGPITAVNDAPVADDDSFTTAEDTPSGPIDLLDGDTDVDGDTLSVASIAGTPLTPGTAQTIAVSNGTVNVSATGEVTFTPDADYNGPVSFDYVVSDANGGTGNGTVIGNVTPVGENNSSITPSSGELPERDELPRPRMYADPIVDLAAGDQGNLFSTPALMSDVNTGLGVKHPIMTALNAIQSLDSTPNLPSEGGPKIETIEATGAISTAVHGIGFNRLFPGNSLATHDFEERLQQMFEQQPAEFVDLTTARGENLYFAVTSLEGQMILQAFATSATGETLPIETITVADTAGVSNTLAADGSSLLNFHKTRDKALLDISLANGYVVHAEIELYETGKHHEIGVDAREIANTTFTAQTESLVFSKDAEASKLLKAIGG